MRVLRLGSGLLIYIEMYSCYVGLVDRIYLLGYQRVRVRGAVSIEF